MSFKIYALLQNTISELKEQPIPEESNFHDESSDLNMVIY